MSSLHHVVFEGLPAVGKSETLELLARTYSAKVRVLPELVKEIVLQSGLDLFRDREALTRAIIDALPARAQAIRDLTDEGFLCLEESHLGVHLAYAKALGDLGFVEAYAAIEHALPTPDAYVRLDIPLALSVQRQAARGTPAFDVFEDRLTAMLANLDRWHEDRLTNLVTIAADRAAHEVLHDIENALQLEYASQQTTFSDTFDVLLLLGRPASGKSEFIDFMTRCPASERAASHHIAPFEVVDDFPILWQLFEDDDLWEDLGKGRLYSKRCNGNYAITDRDLWPFLIRKINQSVSPILTDPRGLQGRSIIVEFSRGGSTGYVDAFAELSDEILSRAAILYVSVSFEESWRRNIARYDEADKGGILTHSVPREEMEKSYGIDDWHEIAPDGLGTLNVRGFELPYVTMPNEPESKDFAVLGPRYREALGPLFRAWSNH